MLDRWQYVRQKATCTSMCLRAIQIQKMAQKWQTWVPSDWIQRFIQMDGKNKLKI